MRQHDLAYWTGSVPTRLLAQLGFAALVLSLAPASRAQEFECPISEPGPLAFEPMGMWTGLSENPGLLGSERLFTLFPGNWRTVLPADGGYRVAKIVWGTNVVDLHAEAERSSLTITGRRLDAESGPLLSWHANTAYIDPRTRNNPFATPTPIDEIDKDSFFITSEFITPSPGCWEVTGNFHGAELKVVIDIGGA